MKKYLFILFFIPLLINAQPGGPPDGGPRHVRKKIEELEKIKLLEILNLDDETAIKFFNRRNDFNNKLHDIEDKKEDKLEELSKAIDKNNEQEINKLIVDLGSIEDNLYKIRKDYTNSLSDILTPVQVAKVLTFERNFRREIRDIIFKARREGLR